MTEEPKTEKTEEGFASNKNEAEIAEKRKERRYSQCIHIRFTRIDKMKFKDRIEFLKECRRCGLQRVFVTKRDFNTANVYVKTYWYDVPRSGRRTEIDE